MLNRGSDSIAISCDRIHAGASVSDGWPVTLDAFWVKVGDGEQGLIYTITKC